MINIVHENIHFDDQRCITAVEIKLKSILAGNNEITGQPLVTTVSWALSKTTLLVDEGRSLKMVLNPKRGNILDLTIGLERGSKMTMGDYAKFHDFFQQSLDETSLP